MHLKTFTIKGFVLLWLLAGVTAFSHAAPSFARESIRTVTGTVTKISDGDTIQITTPEQTILRVRLYGIDAPEAHKINQLTGRINKSGQPYGEEARNALETKVMGKHIRLDIIEIDQYKHMVGIIWIGGRNINLEMLQEGYGEVYYIYLKEPYKRQFIQAQKEAKVSKIGIWSLRIYERPRDFRKRFNMRGGDG